MTRTRFVPARHGFHFSNRDIAWTFGPISGQNLCGGMAYASLDFYYHGSTIPPDTSPPPEHSPLHSYIYHRQVNAHGFMIRTLPFKASFFNPTGQQFAWGMRLQDDFGRVKHWIDRGKPVPILMMALHAPCSMNSHWTVAIGYESTTNDRYGGTCCSRLYLYDNNIKDEVCTLTPNIQGEYFDHSHSRDKYRTYWPDNEFQTQDPSHLSQS